MKDKIKQFTIDESKWCKGELHNGYAGSYCALGFCLKGLGYSDEDMNGLPLPDELPLGKEAPVWMWKKVPTSLCKELVDDLDEDMGGTEFQHVVPAINDTLRLSVDQKRSRLKKVFKWAGINLHFKNSKKSKMK
jgi:hypothetical protein